MRSLITILFILAIASCNAQPAVEKETIIPDVSTSTHQLGSTTISVKTYQYGKNRGPFFISLHDDETTSVEAAMKILQETGGRLVRIENNNERLLEFVIDGVRYRADPNRIFTTPGIQENLKDLNGRSVPVAVNSLKVFAGFLLGKLPFDSTMVIALHNNDEGGLTTNSYSGKGEYAGDAIDIYENAEMDPDDFFLTTEEKIHTWLKYSKYNSVLQKKEGFNDDGSLSVYCALKGRKYVNVEAEHGHLEQQISMIRILLEMSK